MQRAEAKTFFANERTYLAWLHIAVTIGTIATAMLGFAGSASSSKTLAVSLAQLEQRAQQPYAATTLTHAHRMPPPHTLLIELLANVCVRRSKQRLCAQTASLSSRSL